MNAGIPMSFGGGDSKIESEGFYGNSSVAGGTNTVEEDKGADGGN